MRRYLIIALLALACLWPTLAHAQAVNLNADCVITFNFTAAAKTTPFQNTGASCTWWTLTYRSTGFGAISIQADYASDSTGAPGALTVWPSTQIVSGSLPLTTTTENQISLFGYHPWVAVELVSKTGSGRVTGTLYGWRTGPGMDANNTGIPVVIGGSTTGSPIITYAATGGLTVTTVASGAHQIYGVTVDDGVNTADVWVNVYDSTSASAGGTAPKLFWKIPGGTSPTGGGSNPYIPPLGIPLTTGIQWFCSITNAGGASAAPVACGLNLQYK